MLAAEHDTPDLPEDAVALRALLLEARAQLHSLVAECDALASQNERLQHLLLKLKRRQFGVKSERLPEEQLLFAFEEIEATLAANAAEAGKASPALRDTQAKCRRAGRGRLPAAGASATHRGSAGARGDGLPALPGGRWWRSAATAPSGWT